VGKTASLPPKSWWLSLFAVEAVTIKICRAVQSMQSTVISPQEQLSTLERLKEKLLLATQYDSSDGIAYCNIKIAFFIYAHNLDAFEAYEMAGPEDTNKLVCTVKQALETFVVDIDGINVEVHGAPLLSQTPAQLVEGSVVDFMRGLQRHRLALEAFGGPSFIKNIGIERDAMYSKYMTDIELAKQINSKKGMSFACSWGKPSVAYPLLSMYCAGLATVLPSTHTVESDFSVLKFTKSDSRRSLSNYAMEGQMQAKQFKKVKSAVESAGRAQARIASGPESGSILM